YAQTGREVVNHAAWPRKARDRLLRPLLLTRLPVILRPIAARPERLELRDGLVSFWPIGGRWLLHSLHRRGGGCAPPVHLPDEQVDADDDHRHRDEPGDARDEEGHTNGRHDAAGDQRPPVAAV